MYLKTREVCKRLNISRWTLRRRISAGEIEAHKGPYRNSPLQIKVSSVLAYEERYTVPATTSGGAS